MTREEIIKRFMEKYGLVKFTIDDAWTDRLIDYLIDTLTKTEQALEQSKWIIAVHEELARTETQAQSPEAMVADRKIILEDVNEMLRQHFGATQGAEVIADYMMNLCTTKNEEE